MSGYAISAYFSFRYGERETAFKMVSSKNSMLSMPSVTKFRLCASLKTSHHPTTITIGPRFAAAAAIFVAMARADRSLKLPGPSALADLNNWRSSNSTSCAPPSASALDNPCITSASTTPPWLNISDKSLTTSIGAWAIRIRQVPRTLCGIGRRGYGRERSVFRFQFPSVCLQSGTQNEGKSDYIP